MTKYQTLKVKGKGVTRRFYNFITTCEDDGIVHCRRWGCGQCQFCKNRQWLECSQKYICGVHQEAKLKIEGQSKKRKRDPHDTDATPNYKKLVDGKYLCQVCPNPKPILPSSWAGHVRGKAHQSHLK